MQKSRSTWPPAGAKPTSRPLGRPARPPSSKALGEAARHRSPVAAASANARRQIAAAAGPRRSEGSLNLRWPKRPWKPSASWPKRPTP